MRLIPQNPYCCGGPCRAFGMVPEDGVFWRGTEQIQGSLCADELPPQRHILPELDPEYEAVVFEPAGFERCHKFLVEWPERFPHRIETEDLKWPIRQGETEPSVSRQGPLARR
ncbi:MAG TPA: hypothetical protein VFL97_09815 [Nitrococcus sp.]|nr:hypothetical protein [Nitrococcus sp.]